MTMAVLPAMENAMTYFEASTRRSCCVRVFEGIICSRWSWAGFVLHGGDGEGWIAPALVDMQERAI